MVPTVTYRPPSRGVSLDLQNSNIRSRFPQFEFRRQGGSGLWTGALRPRDVSPDYTVTVAYVLGKIPKVCVKRPALVPKAPHLYPDGTLCLYWPEEWRWRQTEFIAETILPWTAQWLFYYELWLDTDEWLGPSSHDAMSAAPKEPLADSQ